MKKIFIIGILILAGIVFYKKQKNSAAEFEPKIEIENSEKIAEKKNKKRKKRNFAKKNFGKKRKNCGGKNSENFCGKKSSAKFGKK